MSSNPQKPSKWAQNQAATILADAKLRYGPAWTLMSQDQRENYINSRVLFLVLGQFGEQFTPAQTTARDVFTALAERQVRDQP